MSDAPQTLSDEEFLRAFGERVRGERARRGMSRRLLADHAGISERYITQLESGRGNASLLILRQIAAALGIPLTRLVDSGDQEPQIALLRQFLSRLSPPQLEEAYASLSTTFALDASDGREGRIAMIGLRGAGKSTLGAALAGALDVPFFELDREVERLSGASLGAILEMYGQPAYRRYELEALETLLAHHPRFVVATGGSIVSETPTYETLLRQCFTVWVTTTPAQHMARVVAQGDHRPMAGSAQAMQDLERILEERTPLYRRADLTVDTSTAPVEESLGQLLARIAEQGRR